MASTNAPFLSKQRTTSIWPARAAMWRAVSPRWYAKKEHLWAEKYCAEWNPHDLWQYLLGGCIRETDDWKTLCLMCSDSWLRRTEQIICQYSQCYGRQEMPHSVAEVKQCWGVPWRQLHGWESDQTRKRKGGGTRERKMSIKCKVSYRKVYCIYRFYFETFPHCLTSVIAWMEAPYLTKSSITFTLFFLQAIWRGVKPFW